MSKHLCDCGKMAVWLYGPSYSEGVNPFHCDDCVPRGCTCNWRYVTSRGLPTEEDKPWKWVVQGPEAEYGEILEGKIWVRLDTDSRESPCAEYDWDGEGWDIERGDIDTHNEDEFER